MPEEIPSKQPDSVNESPDAAQVNDVNPSVETGAEIKDVDQIPSDQDSTSRENQQIEDNPSDNAKSENTEISDNEARLQQLETEHETLKSQYKRIAADFDNFRKRQTRDQDDLRLQLTCTTLSSVLPVVDNFERARQQLDPQGEEAQALHRSYQGLYKQLVEVLKQLGVAPMRVIGQSFDPTLHEAVLREPSDEHPEDVITEELQRGYHLNGRVLRHALVKVSMGPGPKQENVENSVDQELTSNSSIEEDYSSSENEAISD